MKESTTAPVGSSNKRKSYSSNKLWAKRATKRNEALDRNEKYDAMPLLEKLKYVRTLGGCKRQLARLEKQFAAQKAPAVNPAPLTEAQKSAKAVKRATDSVPFLEKAPLSLLMDSHDKPAKKKAAKKAAKKV